MTSLHRNLRLHVIGFLLVCECAANYLTEDLGHGNRLLTYLIRAALILYVILHCIVRTAPETRDARSGNSLALLLVSLVSWISVVSVYHLSVDAQILFEPMRYAYWLCGFLFFYRYPLDTNAMRGFAVWATLLLIILTWQTMSQIGLRLTLLPDSLRAINSSYMLLAAFPLVLLTWRRIYAPLGAATVAGCVVAGLKRGAIVSLVLMLVTTLFVVYRERAPTDRLRSFVKASLAVTVCAALTAMALWLRGDVLLKRFSRDAGLSGREEIYRASFARLQTSTYAEIVLGRGPLSTMRETGLYAHNDWLQLGLDYGLVAVTLYLLIHLGVIRLIAVHYRMHSRLCPALVAGYSVFLIRGFTGGYINYSEMIYFMCVLGASVKAIGHSRSLATVSNTSAFSFKPTQFWKRHAPFGRGHTFLDRSRHRARVRRSGGQSTP